MQVPLRVPPAELAPVVQLSSGQEAEAPPPDAALELRASANIEDIGREHTEDHVDVEEVGGEEQQLDVVDVLRQSLDVLAGALSCLALPLAAPATPDPVARRRQAWVGHAEALERLAHCPRARRV